MFNVWKMECYRMVRMKSFYVIALVVLAMTFLTTFTLHMEYTNPNIQEAQQKLAEEAGTDMDFTVGISIQSLENDGTEVSHMDLLRNNLGAGAVTCFFAIFVVLFCAEEYSGGFIKNYAGQISNRLQIVFARSLAVAVYTVAMTIWYVILQLVSDLIFFGNITMGEHMLGYCGLQTLLSIALMLVIMLVVTVVRSTSVSMVASLAISWKMTTLLYVGIEKLLDFVGVSDAHITDYTITGTMSVLTEALTQGECMKTIGVALAYLVGACAVSGVVFTKRDI